MSEVERSKERRNRKRQVEGTVKRKTRRSGQ
jgi:hypothetical protein